MGKVLKKRVESKVRFSEVDSMRVVWHGNYSKFIEDGREAFGEEFGLGYYDVYNQGLMTPIVKLDIDYKRITKYGEVLIIETEFVECDAAKIIFNYTLYRKSDMQIVVEAKSIQVFTDIDGNLQLTNPEFFTNWKKKKGLL